MSLPECIFVWALVALRHPALRHSHGYGRVDSVLFTRLSMLCVDAAHAAAEV
jgi:hypothetical protein